MVDPRQVASRLLGAIDWQTEVSGFCRCPGEAMHTSQNGKKDCRVNVDGAPTIFCFHASCAPAVAEANRRLRRLLAQDQWAIALPNGRTLRSGDILQRDGTVVPRPHPGPPPGRGVFADGYRAGGHGAGGGAVGVGKFAGACGAVQAGVV